MEAESKKDKRFLVYMIMIVFVYGAVSIAIDLIKLALLASCMLLSYWHM